MPTINAIPPKNSTNPTIQAMNPAAGIPSVA
jgi:hypothetical protein